MKYGTAWTRTYTVSNNPPQIVVRPTACACGARQAFVLDANGVDVMLGCVCHTGVEITPVDDVWKIEVTRYSFADTAAPNTGNEADEPDEAGFEKDKAAWYLDEDFPG